jgi:hypothetical protein
MQGIEQAQLLQRKAAPDLAVLRKLIKALLALGGYKYPRTHDLGLLLDLLAAVDIRIPEALLAVEKLIPFATVFRYDDLPRWICHDPHRIHGRRGGPRLVPAAGLCRAPRPAAGSRRTCSGA